MKITEEKIAQLNKLYKEVDDINEVVSDAIKNAKRNKENELTIARDGKPHTITEALLWEEVRILGEEATEAYSVLSEKYPEVFTASKEQRAKAEELALFTETAFGISSTQIRLKDIMALVEAMVDYKINNSVLKVNYEMREMTEKDYLLHSEELLEVDIVKKE